MIIACTACTNGTGSDGNPCGVCSGDGQIDTSDADFVKIVSRWKVHGMIWDELLTKCDSIIAEQASLREDLTVALEAIWNKVKDI